MRKAKNVGSGEKGQTLVLFALAVGVLIGFMAMSVDVGLLFQDRRELQNTADAAALAGVQELPLNPVSAKLKAQEWVIKHNIPADEIKTIEVRTTDFPNDTLFVQLEQDFDWIFGRVLGQTSSTIGGQAAAQAGSLVGGHDMMPWAIVSGSSTCLNALGEPIFDASCAVKVGAGDGVTGWYGALDMDGNGGGSAEYNANIIDGEVETAYCVVSAPKPPCESSTIDALPGNKVGGTGSGIDDRLSVEPTCGGSDNRDDFDEVFSPNAAASPAYTVKCPQSPRIIIVPIVTLNGDPVKTVTIQGWSLAYLESYGCVGAASCSGGKGYWEVQIRMVDAVYSDTEGFLGAYDPLSPIIVRRLVE